MLFQADSEDSDQSGRMRRLIFVFARRTVHFVYCRAAAQIAELSSFTILKGQWLVSSYNGTNIGTNLCTS